MSRGSNGSSILGPSDSRRRGGHSGRRSLSAREGGNRCCEGGIPRIGHEHGITLATRKGTALPTTAKAAGLTGIGCTLDPIADGLRLTATVEIAAQSGEEALQHLVNSSIDLVFLDIQMPGLTGLQLAEHIPARTQFIFCTAFNSFALDAFELNAVDYLLKPIDESKLNRLLEKIETLKSGFNNEISWANFNESTFINSYLVAFGTHLKKISVQDILCFFSENNATFILTKEGRQFSIHKSLEKIELEIDSKLFFRINRKYIVNKDCIHSVRNTSRIEVSLVNFKEDFY